MTQDELNARQLSILATTLHGVASVLRAHMQGAGFLESERIANLDKVMERFVGSLQHLEAIVRKSPTVRDAPGIQIVQA